jgi:prophage maintenance system killer protein
MRYLALREVLELHRLLLKASGGLAGVRDLGLLKSAVAQPLILGLAAGEIDRDAFTDWLRARIVRRHV